MLLHDEIGISAVLDCCKVFTRVGNLVGYWPRATSTSEEIEVKEQYRGTFEILDTSWEMMQLMTSTSHLKKLLYYFALLPLGMKRKWKAIVIFLWKSALRNTNTYRKQVFDIFWENEIKFVRNENKRIHSCECLGMSDADSAPLSFIDKEEIRLSQLWDVHT